SSDSGTSDSGTSDSGTSTAPLTAEGPKTRSSTLPNAPSQGGNPNVALTRPQLISPLTLVG
ncbi:MAG: hypothetical protein ABI255_08050, partial [Microbacteriaceae bacterium]